MSSNSVRIRALQSRDREDILALIDEYQTGATNEEKQMVRQHIDDYLQAPGVQVYLIAKADGNVVGYISGTPFSEIDDVQPPDGKHAQTSFYCEDLFVRASARRVGIGNHLYTQLVQYARERGFEHMVSVVVSDNIPSLRLHRSYGATERVQSGAHIFSTSLNPTEK